MSVTDIIIVGRKLPRIRAVSYYAGHEVEVSWDEATRGATTEIVDLAPLVFRLKFYAPLRDDDGLRRTVHAINGGTALAWGGADEIDMAAGSVQRLAEEVMTAADFTAFMRRHGFTFERAAAELGISKRLAGYYAAGRPVPRSIAMACELIDLKTGGVQQPPQAEEFRSSATEQRVALAK